MWPEATSWASQEIEGSLSWLAQEVASGHIRWVYGTAGADSFRSGGRPGASVALNAASKACTPVTAVSALYDCAGKAPALRALG